MSLKLKNDLRESARHFSMAMPREWQIAFRNAAETEGLSLSEWVRQCCEPNLPKRIRLNLPIPRKPGRPIPTK